MCSPPRAVLEQGGMHAGSVRSIIADFGGRMEMTKVKAHRLASSAVDDEDRHFILGNDWADTSARRGAEAHPQPSTAEIREANSDWQFYKALACAIAKLSAVWPQARRLFGGRLERVETPISGRGVRPPRPLVPVEHRHNFQPIGGHILCDSCLCRARSWEAARARQRTEPCPGDSSTMRQCMDAQLSGHTLVLGAFAGQPIFICISCGCYASSRLEGLARRCRPAGPAGHQHIVQRRAPGPKAEGLEA